MTERLHVSNHPLVRHHLTKIRDEKTSSHEFRQGIERLAMIIGVQATEDLTLVDHRITTPISPMTGAQLGVSVGLVPVLRAGLGMVDPMLELIPSAAVWHLGLYRNEETAEPVGYYDKLPDADPPDVAFVLDPMLATGGSIEMAVQRLQRWGVPDIRVLCILAARDGVDRVRKGFPNVPIFVGQVDEDLNDHAYIVPGLGDAGDRIFAT